MESSERYRVEGLVVGLRRDGKHRYSESGKQQLLELCQRPGASVSAIAVANGLNPNVVRRWLSLAPAEQNFENDRPATLLPVMLSTESAEEQPCRPATSSLRPTTTREPATEVEFRIDLAAATVRFSAPLDVKTLRLLAAGLADR